MEDTHKSPNTSPGKPAARHSDGNSGNTAPALSQPANPTDTSARPRHLPNNLTRQSCSQPSILEAAASHRVSEPSLRVPCPCRAVPHGRAGLLGCMGAGMDAGSAALCPMALQHCPAWTSPPNPVEPSIWQKPLSCLQDEGLDPEPQFCQVYSP